MIRSLPVLLSLLFLDEKFNLVNYGFLFDIFNCNTELSHLIANHHKILLNHSLLIKKLQVHLFSLKMHLIVRLHAINCLFHILPIFKLFLKSFVELGLEFVGGKSDGECFNGP